VSVRNVFKDIFCVQKDEGVTAIRRAAFKQMCRRRLRREVDEEGMYLISIDNTYESSIKEGDDVDWVDCEVYLRFLHACGSVCSKQSKEIDLVLIYMSDWMIQMSAFSLRPRLMAKMSRASSFCLVKQRRGSRLWYVCQLNDVQVSTLTILSYRETKKFLSEPQMSSLPPT
jgi:hypothetical protein